MSQAEATPAIEYERVSFSYSGRADNGAGAPLALDRVSLTVRSGERLGILGPNGGGKSTLLKLTLGLLGMQEGSIRVLGREPGRARREGLIGYVPQRNEAELAFPVSVRQAVSMAAERGLAPWRRLGSDARRRVERSIALVAAEEFADRPVGRLSGGQLQRAVIARALASNPKVLLLDEPTVGVDVSGQQRFGELMTTLQRELGLTIVIVTHDIRTVAAACDRVACLSRRLHFHDAPKGLTPDVLAEVFRHDLAAMFGEVHVDAHKASECSDPSHGHAIGLTVSADRGAARPGADRGGQG